MLKLRKRFMTLLLALVLAGMLIILYLLLYSVSRVTLPPDVPGRHIGEVKNLLGLPVAIPFALMILSSLGAILSVILMATSVGNEYSWRTIRTMLISSESRFKLLTAKLVTTAIFIIIGMLIGVTVGFLMSLLTTWIGGYAFDFSFFTRTYAWDQFLQFWRTFYVLLPFVTMAFMFAVIGKSAMPGIAFGVGFLFLEPILIVPLMRQAGGWIAKIPDYLFSENVNAITSLANLPQGLRGGMAFGGGQTQTAAPTVAHAFVMLAVFSVAFLIIGYYLFRRRDVTG